MVDLQGVERPDEYGLTDPAIHCKHHGFGKTNLGEEGMKMFIRNHKCNPICEELKLDTFMFKTKKFFNKSFKGKYF